MTERKQWRNGVRVVRGKSLAETMWDPSTGGRATAFDFVASGDRGTWIGTVILQPNAVTGAHHDGRHEVAIYVIGGRSEIRWGEWLEYVTDLGDCGCIDALVVHCGNHEAVQHRYSMTQSSPFTFDCPAKSRRQFHRTRPTTRAHGNGSGSWAPNLSTIDRMLSVCSAMGLQTPARTGLAQVEDHAGVLTFNRFRVIPNIDVRSQSRIGVGSHAASATMMRAPNGAMYRALGLDAVSARSRARITTMGSPAKRSSCAMSSSVRA
jgi:uncharacterized RmlC-like cupin family protein